MKIGGKLLLMVIGAAVVMAVMAVPVARADEQSSTAFQAVLAGANEVPPRDTHARGLAHFELSADGTSISYRLIAANIENAFMAHIHLGPVGQNGPIVVWLFPSVAPTPGPVGGGRVDGVIATGTFTASNLVGPLAGMLSLSALVEAMNNGGAYVNIHTNDGIDGANTGPGDFPGGEIRGQIFVATDED